MIAASRAESASPQRLADAALVDLAAALALVDEDHRRAGVGEVLVAPVHQGHQHRPEVEPLLGEEVLVAAGALAVGPALEDALVDEALEAGGEDVAGDRRATAGSPRSGACRGRRRE